MSFKDYLQITAKEIDRSIEDFFYKWSKEIEQISLRLMPGVSALGEACRGGKRIRGSLVKFGYELGKNEGQQNNSEILKIAMAYEIFQAAILAHDDIIDKSIFRRGVPSLYNKLGGDHLGISKAICLGDIGFFLVFNLIGKSSFSEKDKNQVLIIFSNAMLETGLGELLDVELSQAGTASAAIQDIITVYTYKTAYYTISAPFLVGASLGGISERRMDAIRKFGQNLGIAFQIQDDINDMFNEEKKLGKEPGGDLKEGKQTLLYVTAKSLADIKQRKLLEKFYGNPEVSTGDIEVVKKVFEDSGALESALRDADMYVQKAKESIREISKKNSKQEMLLEMTEYFGRRR